MEQSLSLVDDGAYVSRILVVAQVVEVAPTRNYYPVWIVLEYVYYLTLVDPEYIALWVLKRHAREARHRLIV